MFKASPALAFAAVVAAPAFLAAPASAQDAGWAMTVGAATDNRSKDASKSDGKPFVFGTAEWSSASGFFYAGPGFETIDSSTGSKLELQAYAGIRPQVAGFDLDLKAAYKHQVDANPGADNDAWEFTANLSRSIGPAKARLQLQHSPDGSGGVKSWTWVEARAGWDFTDKLEGAIALGRREQDGAPDYTGWNAGLTYAATRSLDLELTYYDTNAKVPLGQSTRQYDGALVAGVRAYF